MSDKFDEVKIRNYLSDKLKGKVTNVKLEKLGSGVVGTGYSVSYKLNNKPQRKILKTLFKENLSLDHHSDRARSLILANENYNTMDKHVKSFDVVGVTKGKEFVSIGNSEEFYILMEEATGEDFFKDLESLKNKKSLDDEIKTKIENLAKFLVKIHKKKLDSNSLYKRKIRETIGSDCLMGVFDVYPEEVNWTSWEEIGEMVKRSVNYWISTRNMKHRLCEIHGDYHPGNLWFEDGDFTVLDRARGTWGEAADDLTAFLINPIFYSLAKKGEFSGVYKEVFDLFWNSYFKKTQDLEMRKVMAPYFAFRVAVVCTPMFYEDEFFGSRENAVNSRRKLFNFALNSLKDKEFRPEKIKEYLN